MHHFSDHGSEFFPSLLPTFLLVAFSSIPVEPTLLVPLRFGTQRTFSGLLLKTKTWERPRPRLLDPGKASPLINMLFKEKEKQQQEDQLSPPLPIDGEAPICMDEPGEESTPTDESNAKEFKSINAETTYPSGLKLALLMMSIFVGMFLVSLVSQGQASISP